MSLNPPQFFPKDDKTLQWALKKIVELLRRISDLESAEKAMLYQEDADSGWL